MTQLNVHQAKTHLSKALAWVQAGEEVIIAKNGRPLAKLVPVVERRKKPRPFGTAKGLIRIVGDWNDPLPASVLKSFEK